MMKKIASLLLAAILFVPSWVSAQDYMVTFIKEQYRETKEGETSVYHTWYVDTDHGKKLLVLTGDDMPLRGWLREFVKEFDLYLLSIPKSDTATFEESTVFRVDIHNLHPLDRELVESSKKKKKRRK
jgi:hypothetical protein